MSFPNSWEDPAFKEFWEEIPGRAKHVLRRFPPGIPVRVKKNWPHCKRYLPHPIVGWVLGISKDAPPKLLVLPVNPGLVQSLVHDDRMTEEGKLQLIDEYAIRIEPEFVELIPS